MLKNNGFHNRHSPILRAFSPLSLFSGGAPGAWYDPSDLTTLFQDSAGTTPVTAVEQPVGLMLDKSQGLVLGPELVTNGDFSNGTTGWTGNNATLSAVSGGLQIAATGQFPSANQSITVTAGRTYKISFSVVSATTGFAFDSLTLRIGSASSPAVRSDAVPSTMTAYVTAAATGVVTLQIIGTSLGVLGDVWRIDNISVKELPGNHAFQSTSASRPVLSARVNKLLATATLATQSVTTRAAAHTLRFEGAGSITLSGTATGTFAAGSHSVTATAGTLTLTVSGSVTSADLRETNDGVGVPAYQAVVTSTNYATTGFLPYLRFDGVDDSLSTNSISFTATDKMSVFAGMRKLSDAGIGMVAELSGDSNSNNGTFFVAAPVGATTGNYGVKVRGNISALAAGYAPATYTSPITNVVDASLDLSGSTRAQVIIPRVNGIVRQGDPDANTLNNGGNFGNYPLFIGRRNNASLPFNGQLYSMVIVGKAVTAGELSSTETYVNQKTGAYA